MKFKAILLFPIAAGSLALTGCNEKFEPIKLQYGQMISTSTTENTYQDLKEKIDDKDTFLLTVYAKNCYCWNTFKNIAKTYIDSTHVQIFSVDYEQFHSVPGKTLDTFGLNIKSGVTSFHIVKEGKVVLNVRSDESKTMEKYSEFEKMMNETVKLPKMFYINKNQLDTLYATDQTSAVYFYRSNCGDCGYMNKSLLKNYDPKGNLYILDCETIGIRQYDEDGKLTPESQIAWNKFKEDYGLAKKYNPTYGYDTGYVPTLMLIKGNSTTHKPTYLSGSVYLNDSVEKIGEKYYLNNSFYTEERLANLQYLSNFQGTKVLQGMELKEEEVQKEFMYWYKESAEKYHNPLATAFLDYALPLVTIQAFKK